MSAKIYPFKKPKKTSKLPTKFQVFQEVFDDVLADWQVAASKNKLDEYVSSKIPKKYRSKFDYTSDLNALSTIENELGIKMTSFAPGTTSRNPIGWMAAFHLSEKEAYACPPEMVTEPIARAFSLVLFIEFDRTLKSLEPK